MKDYNILKEDLIRFFQEQYEQEFFLVDPLDANRPIMTEGFLENLADFIIQIYGNGLMR